jgi:hypothetical protein
MTYYTYGFDHTETSSTWYQTIKTRQKKTSTRVRKKTKINNTAQLDTTDTDSTPIRVLGGKPPMLNSHQNDTYRDSNNTNLTIQSNKTLQPPVQHNNNNNINTARHTLKNYPFVSRHPATMTVLSITEDMTPQPTTTPKTLLAIATSITNQIHPLNTETSPKQSHPWTSIQKKPARTNSLLAIPKVVPHNIKKEKKGGLHLLLHIVSLYP